MLSLVCWPARATDWQALRAAYAASPAYDPDAGANPLAAGIAASVARQDFRLAASLAEQALAHDAVDVRAHLLAASAYTHLDETARASEQREAGAGLLRAIMATGTGTRASPVKVIGGGEMTAVLQSLHLHVRGQALEETDGHAIEVVSVKHDGRLGEMYFNVDVPFGRQVSLAAARAR